MQTDVNIVSVDGAEPIDVAFAKNYLRQDHALDDEIITLAISAAREVIEKYCGVSIVDKTLKVQFFDFEEYDLGEDGYITLNLPQGPIKTVESMETVNSQGTATAYTNYTVFGLKNKRVTFEPQYTLDSSGFGVYNLQYTTGFTDVPKGLKIMVAKLLAHNYEVRGVAVYDMSVADIPMSLKDQLKPYRNTFI